MTPFRIGSGVRAAAMTTTAFVALAGFAQSAKALTAADTVIRNQATATYKDAGGNSYQAQSNLAEITVKQVYDATLALDRTKEGAAGQTIYSTHSLSNLGNGDAYYNIDIANIAGDSGDYSMIEVFVDSNGNGVADPGEEVVADTAGVSKTIMLAPNEIVNLLVAAKAPNGAPAGNTYGAMITATPTDAAGAAGAFGDVRDTTTAPIAGVSDVTDPTGPATNHLLTTITNNAVLNVFKSSVYDATTNQITYTVTVKNTGAKDATDVKIFDGLPAGTTLITAPGSIQSIGFGSNPGDTAAAAGAPLNEVTDAKDYNNDGDMLDTAVPSVSGVDGVLAVGASVNMVFKVSIDPMALGAGEVVTNVAYAQGDLNGDGTPDTAEPSNPTNVVAPKIYAVDINDTNAGAGAGVNDGGDDDTLLNDIQFVDSAPAGATVIFDNKIVNNGNSTEVFNITYDTSTFPAGTVITFWNGTGTVQLLDTDGDGKPNTPPLDPGQTYDIQVRIQLPADATPTTTDMTVRVNTWPANQTSAVSRMVETLSAIIAPSVDLANNAADADKLVNKDPYSLVASVPTAPGMITLTADPGATVDFPLTIENDGGVSDAFQLYAGGGWFGGASAPTAMLQAMHTGWTVQFIDSTGAAVTTTPSIPAGGVYNVTARVTLPTEAYRALANYTGDFASSTAAADGVVDSIDGNATGDKDYPIFFMTKSVSSGAYDVTLDAVDVNPIKEFTVLADQANQIAPGGSSTTDHTVQNTGNTPRSVELTSTNSRPTESWGQSVKVDTNGDGVADTPIEAVVPGGVVWIEDVNGNPISVTVTDTDGDGNVEIPLQPGETIPVEVTVYAPTSAPNGQVDVVTLTATDEDGATESAQIVNTVVIGKLKLAKTASVDATCAGAAALDLGPDVVFTENTNKAAPGDCVIWQIVATNTGTDPVNTVEITDAAPGFTTYKAGTLRYCAADAGTGLAPAAGCTFTAQTDAADADKASVSGTDILVNLGADTIAAGASVTIRFATQVD